MVLKKIRQTHHFNLYTVLWILALVAFVYLMQHWYIDKTVIGIVENKAHPLSAGESGKLEKVLVSIGDQVKKDQVLALLDISDLKSNLTQLTGTIASINKVRNAHHDRYAIEVNRMALELENEAANLIERLSMIESHSAELAGLNAEIDRLTKAEMAGLGQNRDLADLILQRNVLTAYLTEQNKYSAQQKIQLEKAQKSRSLLEKANLDAMTSSLLLEQMQYVAELERLFAETEYRIGLRTIVAPCDGFVTEITAQAGDAVDAFIPFVSVNELSPRYADIYIPEKSSLVPQIGMPVELYSSRGKDYNVTGSISFVHPGFSMASERFAIQNIFFWARKVRVELPAEHQLLPGEIVKARVLRNHKNYELSKAEITLRNHPQLFAGLVPPLQTKKSRFTLVPFNDSKLPMFYSFDAEEL